MIKTISLFLIIQLIGLNVAFAQTRNSFPSSPIKIAIELNKNEFTLGEDLAGKVTIQNGYANGLPNVFTIKMYHEGKFFNSYTTSIPHIPLGNMSLTLQACGIPNLTQDKNSVGEWTMTVFQQNTNEQDAVKVKFRINPRP